METVPERQDPIKFFLSVLMSDEDVARYSDPSCAIETLERGELCWQAAVSIGVLAGVVGVLGKTDDQKGLVENLVGHALKPMEALHERLTQEARQQALTDEQARMLFHLRFGLGFLFLAKGEREAGKAFLHDMAATKLSRHGGGQSYRSGDDIVSYTDDMGWGKVLAAIMACDPYSDAEDYDEALYLMMEAGDTTGHYTVDNAVGLLDRWAARCEAIEQREGADELDAFLEWTPLLYSAAEVVSVCQQVDTSGVLPGECDKASPQFLAYKLGQLAARFAAKNADLWHHFLDEVEEEPGRFDFLVEALLCDHEPGRDWQKVRDRYLAGWRRTPCYEGTSPEEIGPHMDLYWAMRIGFADKMLESTRALEVAAVPVAIPGLIDQMQRIEDIASTIALRQLRHEREFDERLPQSRGKIAQSLAGYLGDVWGRLPSDVEDALLSAEYSHEAGWRTDISTREVVERFHSAVEACFHRYFVDPFAAYLRRGDVPSAPLCFRGWRGQWQDREFKADNPSSVSLSIWAGVFEALTDPGPTATENLHVKTFVNHNWPELPLADLKELADPLRRIQSYRNLAAHRQSPPRPLQEAKTELDDMRKVVLGIGSPSVITEIYRLLTPSKQS